MEAGQGRPARGDEPRRPAPGHAPSDPRFLGVDPVGGGGPAPGGGGGAGGDGVIGRRRVVVIGTRGGAGGRVRPHAPVRRLGLAAGGDRGRRGRVAPGSTPDPAPGGGQLPTAAPLRSGDLLVDGGQDRLEGGEVVGIVVRLDVGRVAGPAKS